MKEFLKAAAIRAVRTVARAAAARIGRLESLSM